MKTRSISLALAAAALLSGPAAALADSPAPAATAAANAASDKAVPPAASASAAPAVPASAAPGDKAASPAAPGDKAASPAASGDKAASPAAPSAGGTSTARQLFEAGSRAYAVGNYRAAIQAFEQAFSAEARPGLLFSIAQAHRRQYRVDGRPGHVAVAMRRYKEYLAQVRQGGRRADAEAALAELAPIAQRLEQEGQLLPTSGAETETATRLIVTTQAPGAKVLVDDDKTPRDAPLISEVTAGRHRIRVIADDHFEEAREIEVAAGAVTALDLSLKEKPAVLSVDTVSGARVSLDGRFVGEAPLAGAVEIQSGSHRLEVSRAGFSSFTKTLDVSAGQKVTVAAPLSMTLQRRVSIGLMGGGAAAVAGGVVLGGLALVSQADAASVKGAMERGEVVCRGDTCPELDRYNSSVGARDGLRAASFTLLGVGALAGGGGLFLYLVDGLPIFGGARGEGAGVSAAPVVTPEVSGFALSGRF